MKQKAKLKCYKKAGPVKSFDEFYKKVPADKNDTSGYDLRGYYNNDPQGAMSFLTPKTHALDTYKKPSHITFSNESKYSDPNNPGGNWGYENEQDVFNAAPQNVTNAGGAQRLQEYFNEKEKGVKLVQPSPYDYRWMQQKKTGGLMFHLKKGGKVKGYEGGTVDNGFTNSTPAVGRYAGGGGIEYADSKFWEDRPVQKQLRAPGYADGNVVKYTKDEHIPFVKENEGTAKETWRAPNKYQFTQPVPKYTKNSAPKFNTPTGELNLSNFKMPDVNLPKMQINSSKDGASYLSQIAGLNEPEHIFNMAAGLGMHHQFKGPLGIDVGVDTDAMSVKGLNYFNKNLNKSNATTGGGAGFLTRASASINPSVGFKGTNLGLYGNARVASNYMIPTISKIGTSLVSMLPNGGGASTGTQKIDTYGKLGAGIYYDKPFGWKNTRLKAGPVVDYDFQKGTLNPSFKAEITGNVRDKNSGHAWGLSGSQGSMSVQYGGGQSHLGITATLRKPINSKSNKYIQPNTNYKIGGKIKYKTS